MHEGYRYRPSPFLLGISNEEEGQKKSGNSSSCIDPPPHLEANHLNPSGSLMGPHPLQIAPAPSRVTPTNIVIELPSSSTKRE